MSNPCSHHKKVMLAITIIYTWLQLCSRALKIPSYKKNYPLFYPSRGQISRGTTDHFYRAHTKYDAKVMFSEFLSFCPQGGGGGVKIEKCSECHGKPKKCIKIFPDYTPLDQVGGGRRGSLVPTLCPTDVPPGGVGHLVDKVGTKDPPPPPPTLSTRCATGGGG